jgi:hypothetical protein
MSLWVGVSTLTGSSPRSSRMTTSKFVSISSRVSVG